MEKTIPLVTGQIYHIYSKSIFGYKIFNRANDFKRMLLLIQYYQYDKQSMPLCHFLESYQTRKLGFSEHLKKLNEQKEKRAEIVAYCLMPTHVHFILRQTRDNGISHLLNKTFSGYSLYFNLLHNRRGPLWQSRFGRRLIKDDRDLIVTSHYVHANPVKDLGKATPKHWPYCSYNEYCCDPHPESTLCDGRKIISLKSIEYESSMNEYLLNRVG